MSDAQKLIADVLAQHQEFVVSLEESLPSYRVRCQGNGEVDGCAWDSYQYTYDEAVRAFNDHLAAEIDNALGRLTREREVRTPHGTSRALRPGETNLGERLRSLGWRIEGRWVSGWSEAQP